VTKKQPSNLGSSETREAPLFKNHSLIYFQNAQPDHIKITDVKFLQWFILVKVMVLLLFLKPIVALL
jgi:hypothetical protein